MKPVNLLPAKHRPRTPTGGQQGSAYVLVGVLGLILVMVVFYVLTVNSVNEGHSQVARAKAETAHAQARISALSSYGDFSKIKAERVQSVRYLAEGRIDWERLTRGLARVLPDDVWLLTANASASGEPSSPGSSQAPSSSDKSAPSPAVQLTGCAPSHAAVAVTLVRLKELSGASDVQLNEITRPMPQIGTPTPGGTSAGGSDSDCGSIHGNPAAKWDATVTFAPATPGTHQPSVPRSLGGGA